MAIVATNARSLHGPWASGFALDKHSLISVPIGQYQSGRTQFETTRSPVGQLLYEIKYVGYTAAAKQAKADDLADTAADFVKRTWRLSADLIIPVPPSNVRSVQPVMLVATALSSRLGVPICNDCLKKVKETPQLKDIRDYDERKEVLDGAFAASAEFCAGKRLLLFDDLHGSGATVSHIVDVLKAAGAKSVSLLTLTSKK